jgi:dihydrofolate reductase
MNRGRDVHLVGGVQTIETFRAMGALDKLGLLVLPFFLGAGMQLTPSISTDTNLVLEEAHTLVEGAVEIIYACS